MDEKISFDGSNPDFDAEVEAKYKDMKERIRRLNYFMSLTPEEQLERQEEMHELYETEIKKQEQEH